MKASWRDSWRSVEYACASVGVVEGVCKAVVEEDGDAAAVADDDETAPSKDPIRASYSPLIPSLTVPAILLER